MKRVTVLLSVCVLFLLAFSGCSDSGRNLTENSNVQSSAPESSNAKGFADAQVVTMKASGQISDDNVYLDGSPKYDMYKCLIEGGKLIVFRDSADLPFITLPAAFAEDFYEFGYEAYAGEDWVVLLSSPALGRQTTKILLYSEIGGEWHEVGNANKICPETVSGAGFFSGEVGFLSFRYLEAGVLKIYQTKDGGATWEWLSVELPDAFCEYKMTPLSPSISGGIGSYPVAVYDNVGFLKIIFLTSTDNGLTWRCAD